MGDRINVEVSYVELVEAELSAVPAGKTNNPFAKFRRHQGQVKREGP
jgi:hypothetical protein